jgi:hypothetical protein
MTLLPVTLSHAGPLSSDILSLEVTEYPFGARVVTVMGEIDGLTAPELNAVLTEQLVAGQFVVVNLDDVRFMGSAGLAVAVRGPPIRSPRRPRPAFGVQLPDCRLGIGRHRVEGAFPHRRYGAGCPDGLMLTKMPPPVG